MGLTLALIVILSIIATFWGVSVTLRAVYAPDEGAAGPRQARRIVFGIGLALAATTSACLVVGLVHDMPTLVTASLVIGLEEAWEWTMLTALLKRAEAVELEHCVSRASPHFTPVAGIARASTQAAV